MKSLAYRIALAKLSKPTADVKRFSPAVERAIAQLSGTHKQRKCLDNLVLLAKFRGKTAIHTTIETANNPEAQSWLDESFRSQSASFNVANDVFVEVQTQGKRKRIAQVIAITTVEQPRQITTSQQPRRTETTAQMFRAGQDWRR